MSTTTSLYFHSCPNTISNDTPYNDPSKYSVQTFSSNYPTNYNPKYGELTLATGNEIPPPDPQYPITAAYYGILKDGDKAPRAAVFAFTISTLEFTKDNGAVIESQFGLNESNQRDPSILVLNINGGEPLTSGLLPTTLIIEAILDKDATATDNIWDLTIIVQYNSSTKGTYKFTKSSSMPTDDYKFQPAPKP